MYIIVLIIALLALGIIYFGIQVYSQPVPDFKQLYQNSNGKTMVLFYDSKSGIYKVTDIEKDTLVVLDTYEVCTTYLKSQGFIPYGKAYGKREEM